MSTSVMLSIKPEFVERIFNGTKQYEFRRKVFRDRSVRRVVVYATAPISQVVGEFEIDDILELELDCLWERTKNRSGIGKHFFDVYFSGVKKGYALKIGKTLLYETPLQLQSNFNVKHPPQSFVYLPSKESI